MSAIPETPTSTDETTANRWLCVGVIAGAHGVSGEVKIKAFTDTPHSLAELQNRVRGKNGRSLGIKTWRVQKDMLIARLAGVDTREQAHALKGEELYVPRDSLQPVSEDEYYQADLIGLSVIDSRGHPIGRVAAVQNFGAGDLLELTLDHPRRFVGSSPMVPFDRATVPEIDLARRRLTVRIDEWIDSWVSAEPTEDKGES